MEEQETWYIEDGGLMDRNIQILRDAKLTAEDIFGGWGSMNYYKD